MHKSGSLICCYTSSSLSSWWFEQIEQGEENEINTFRKGKFIHPLTCTVLTWRDFPTSLLSLMFSLELLCCNTRVCQISLSSFEKKVVNYKHENLVKYHFLFMSEFHMSVGISQCGKVNY